MAYEGISSFLHNGRHKALHKAVQAMGGKVNIQCNRLLHLEDSMLMYDIYNAETLENLINTVHQMHNAANASLNEKLFAGKFSIPFTWYVNKNGGTSLCNKFTFIFENDKGKICKDA